MVEPAVHLSTSKSSTIYRPLENTSSVRIATIQPGNPEDPLSLSITHHDFNDEGLPYEALSYVWGDPLAVTEPISVDDIPLYVTTNLYLALRRLRDDKKTRRIWIDAICIDQKNIEERNQQVSLMRLIYSRASNVIIWTGEEQEEFIRATYEAGQKIKVSGLFELNRDDPHTRKAIPQRILGDDDLMVDIRKARTFLENPWFHRVWTFQEVFLSRQAVIFCGRCILRWGLLMFLWLFLHEAGLDLLDWDHASPNALIATYARSRVKEGTIVLEEPWYPNVGSLLSLVRGTFSHGATDPRDKIFGLLAIVNHHDETMLRPDYSVSVEEVYIRFAMAMLVENGHLQLFSDVDRTEHSVDLPSWVPDWRGHPKTNPLAERVPGSPQRYYADKGFVAAEPTFKILDGSKLGLDGLYVDVVKRSFNIHILLEITARGEPLAGQWQAVLSVYRAFHKGCELASLALDGEGFRSHYFLTGEPAFTTFIRTLAADTLPQSSRRDEHERKDFFPWHHDLSKLCWRACLYLNEEEVERMNMPPGTWLPGAAVEEVYENTYETSGRPRMWYSLDPLRRLLADDVYCNLAREIIRSISRTIRNRAIFLTKLGLIGIGPSSVKEGDHVCVLLGGDVPFVLRPAGQPSEYQLVGDCYVHGIMDGELGTSASEGNPLDMLQKKIIRRDITII